MGEEIYKYIDHGGGSANRGNHIFAKKAENIAFELRREIALLLGIKKYDHISFTYNATYGINLLLKGFLKRGDHVVISSFVHNSLLRPLHYLSKVRGVTYDIWECDSSGLFDIKTLEKLIKKNTRLFFFSLHSNVLGMALPLKDITELSQKKDIALALDCTQSIGNYPLKLEGVDMAVGSGHKGLYGPTGTGFIYVKNPYLVTPLIQGGGGHLSSHLDHPEMSPERFEAGTLNMEGLTGLLSSIRWVKKHHSKVMDMFYLLFNTLKKMDKVTVYGDLERAYQIPILSFNIENFFPSQIEHYLSTKRIICRAGLCCAPLIHKRLSTFPLGVVRVSLSCFTTKEQIEEFLVQIRLLTRKKREELCSKLH